MKRKVLSMLLASVMVFSLAACSSTGSSSTEESTSTSTETTSEEASSEEEITLTWLHHFEEEAMQEWIQEVTDAYTELHPNVTFDVQYTGYDNYTTLLKTKIAGDDAPDIFDLQGLGSNIEFVDNGYLMDLSDTVVADRLVETALDGGSIDGTLYLIPYEMSGFGVYYNVEVFEELGITETPKTYDEFIEVCEIIEAAGITPIGQSYADLWTLTCDFFADSLNAQLIDDEEWHDKIVTRDYTFSANDGGIIDTWIRLEERLEYGNSDQFATDWSTVTAKMATGEIAMTLNGTWTTANIQASSEEAADVEIGTFAFPFSNDESENQYPLGANSGFVGFSGSKNQETVIDFFDFITQDEQAKTMAEARDSLSVVEGVTPDVGYTLNQIITDYVETDMVRSISNVNRDFPGEYQTVYYEVLSEYLLTDLSVEDAMAELDSEFDRIAESE